MKKLFILFSAIFSIFSFGCSSVEKNSDSVCMTAVLPFNESPEVASQMYKAMRLAVDEVNASRDRMAGKELKLDIRSDGEGVDETCSVLDSVLESSVDILHIALRSPVIFKNDDLVASKKFINYMNDYAPATIQSENAVRIFLSATQVCEQMNAYLERNRGDREELAVIALVRDDLMGRSAAAYLKYELGGEGVKFYDEFFKLGETKFDIFAEQMQNLNIDYVFVMSSGVENVAILNALHKAGFEGGIVFDRDVKDSYLLPEGVCYNFVVPSFSIAKKEEKPSVLAFKDKYMQAYGQAPSYEAAYAYDSIILSAKAYNESPTQMPKFFFGKTFEGAVGTIKFDNTGDSSVNMSFGRSYTNNIQIK